MRKNSEREYTINNKEFFHEKQEQCDHRRPFRASAL